MIIKPTPRIESKNQELNRLKQVYCPDNIW